MGVWGRVARGEHRVALAERAVLTREEQTVKQTEWGANMLVLYTRILFILFYPRNKQTNKQTKQNKRKTMDLLFKIK